MVRGGANARKRERMTVEPTIGPAPVYSQTTITPDSTGGSRPSSHDSTTRTPTFNPTDGSITLTPSFVLIYKVRERLELESGEEEEADMSMAGGSHCEGSRAVHGEDRPLQVPGPGQLKKVVEIFNGVLIGPGVPRFFLNNLRRLVTDLWVHYADIPQKVLNEIWTAFFCNIYYYRRLRTSQDFL